MADEDCDAGTPAYFLYKIRDIFLQRLKEENQLALYRDIEMPLLFILYEMERCGFKIDRETMAELSDRYGNELEGLSAKIFELAGESFNINSPKQLAVILFDKLKLKSGKKTKSGYSTDSDVLEKLADGHAIVPLILRYRKISKLNGTYIEGLRRLPDNNDLIHTVFKQALTSTGRLSSIEPNLQNIPIREEDGREIRRMFIARGADRTLISADYSQIELRLLAHFAGDETLIEAFKNGADIHTATAAQVFGVEPGLVTAEMRRASKAVNFGIIYGISDFGLANQLGRPPSYAHAYIEKYFEKYARVKEYMQANVQFARERGYSVTVTGRKRYIPELQSPNYNVRSFGERAAMNMPLQGSAADIIKIAMINVYNRLKNEGLRSVLILSVHDELIVDAFLCEKAAVKKILREEMESAMLLNVPLRVGMGEGANWFEAK
jgi:DNA polymerase-1